MSLDVNIFILFFGLLLFGCGEGGDESSRQDADKPSDTSQEEGQTISSRSGPVTATVSFFPKTAKLGDPLTLILTVRAKEGVEVQMPAFGEALGRFAILDYAPTTRTLKDGGTEHVQRYSLDSPMSGVRTIPPLRVEFIDRRQDDQEEVYELLTEKVSVTIESVLPEGDITEELRPPRDKLPERFVDRKEFIWGILLAVILLGGLVIYLVYRRRLGRAERARVSAFDVAWGGLSHLESDGMPEADQADRWYVELSGIVRTYIEDRFGLKAPELTTEEFIRVAWRSEVLTREHRPLLHSFLEKCDQVKFAGYRPGKQESAEAIGSARRFLEETKVFEIQANTVSMRSHAKL